MFGDENRFGRAWEPWRDLNRLQDEVNRLFSGALETKSGGYPALRVWSKDDGAVLEAAIPGVSSENIEISVLGDSVTLAGKRMPQEVAKGVTVHRRERDYGSFARTVQLPFRIEADQVRAVFHQGVLELTLPRALADMPKRIAVKAD